MVSNTDTKKPNTKNKAASLELVKSGGGNQMHVPPENLVRKKEIYDHVTVATGLRKREVREAVDTTLAYLFECLSNGQDVQCPPLGKIKVITRNKGDETKVHYRLALQKTRSAKKDAIAAKEGLEAGDNSD